MQTIITVGILAAIAFVLRLWIVSKDLPRGPEDDL
jgi:riboflavin transporter FmnP